MKDIPLKQFATKLHFKKLTAEDIKNNGSFNLVDDGGEFLAIVVVPASAEKKMQVQNIAAMGNKALGKG